MIYSYYISSVFTAFFTSTFLAGAFFSPLTLVASIFVTLALVQATALLTFTHDNSALIALAINSVDLTEFVLAGIKLSTNVSLPFVFKIAYDLIFKELASLIACSS
ncbi:MAG: hypothetical protein Q8S84_00665 [bacterium]|nr:hypothetical protein [bacterium]MDP3380098.1 hypothetical protein [bacterium]